MPIGTGQQKSILQVFISTKMAFLLLLGFSSGLPLFLTSRTLQAWLTIEGIDLTTIGLFSLVALPYSLKFLWSPILDRFSIAGLGRRKGWMFLSQLLLLCFISSMAFLNPSDTLPLIASLALAIAFLSATQDIAIDAYRTDVLKENEMGSGAAVSVLGYRIGLLFTGAFALILADYLSWQSVYLVMATFMLVGLATSFWTHEPEKTHRAPSSLRAAAWEPFTEFVERLGSSQALLVLSFIVVYKLGDALVNNMTTPFLLQTGFTQTDIGLVQGGTGLLASIFGVLVGGALLNTLGIYQSLWIFGFFQAGSNLLYLILAEMGFHYPMMFITITVEYFSAGLGTAAFIAFLMSLCNHRFTATQYALMSSLMAVSRDVLAAPAGRIAETTGWSIFFLISFAAAIPGLGMLLVIKKQSGHEWLRSDMQM